MDVRLFNKLLMPIRRRIRVLFSRCVGHLVDPATLLQTVQVELLKGETLDSVEHAEGYGRTANPPAGWEGVAASLGGDSAHTLLLSAFHRQYRVRNLAPGEQALYDDLGNVIHLKRDRILVNSVDMTEVIAPLLHIAATTTHDGDLTINGNLVVNGVTVTDGLGVTGTAGSTYIDSDVAVTGGDITVDGISSKHHKHQENDVNGLTGEAQ